MGTEIRQRKRKVDSRKEITGSAPWETAKGKEIIARIAKEKGLDEATVLDCWIEYRKWMRDQ